MIFRQQQPTEAENSTHARTRSAELEVRWLRRPGAAVGLYPQPHCLQGPCPALSMVLTYSIVIKEKCSQGSGARVAVVSREKKKRKYLGLLWPLLKETTKTLAAVTLQFDQGFFLHHVFFSRQRMLFKGRLLARFTSSSEANRALCALRSQL